jgi:hypothetical protein
MPIQLTRNSKTLYTINFISTSSSTKNATYILHTDTKGVPEGTVIWDTFGSKEFFSCFKNDERVFQLLDNFSTIIDMFSIPLDEHNGQSFNLLSADHQNIPSWTKRFCHSLDGTLYNGWSFSTSLLFRVQKDVSDSPLCKHYTGHNSSSGAFVQSVNYHFSNIPHSVESVCSNPKVYVSKLTPHPCVFSIDHQKCPFYEINEDILTTKEIVQFGGSKITFQAVVSETAFGQAQYKILRLSSSEPSSVCYSVLSDKRTDQTDSSLLEVLDEVISSYEDSFTSVQNVSSFSEKNQNNTFILSLV